MLNRFLDIAPEVAFALSEKRGVVALESTIIAHGMPYPRNVETALKVEEQVRRYGSVPATIAILDGRLKVGLRAAEIRRLGELGQEVMKVSRRDMPYVISKGLPGATTVASTMIIARMAGIRVFATGGIGGVHRRAETTMDISADLQELARTSVAVVSAGAKAILDLGLTLEYLETYGVPVIGYRTSEFPAFYTRRSGLQVDNRIDTVEEMAQLLRAKWALGLEGGVLIANPIPETYQMDHYQIEQAISRALGEADARGITGKAITPFLLERIESLTSGASLEANIQLVLNNAKVGAQLAAALGKK